MPISSVRCRVPASSAIRAAITRRGFEGGEFFEAVREKGILTVQMFHAANDACIRFYDGTELRFDAPGNYLNEFDLVSCEMRTGQIDSRYEPHGITLAVMKQLDECRALMELRYPFETE